MAQAKKKQASMKMASEAIKVWSRGLQAELERWPGVTVKRAFGMLMAYRGQEVFAALPDTRAIHREDAIMVKFAEEKPALIKRMSMEARFVPGPRGEGAASGRTAKGESRKWRFFLIREDADVHAAIEWLAEAYQLAGKRKG